MGTLIDEVSRSKDGRSCQDSSDQSCSGRAAARAGDSGSSVPAEGSLLGDASVVTGAISTHEPASLDDSADTPPSYAQLNYKQNLERYFDSQPKLVSSESDTRAPSGAETLLSYTHLNYKQNLDRYFQSQPNRVASEVGGAEGSSDNKTSATGQETSLIDPTSLSQQMSSSISNSMSHSRTSGTFTSSEDFKGLPLTKLHLARHNQEMEKRFMQHYRDLRHRSSRRGQARPYAQPQDKAPHGVKRHPAASWEGQSERNKHPHTVFKQYRTPQGPQGFIHIRFRFH